VTSAQVSDWSRRPLTARQLAYSALDAASQLLMLERMLVPHGCVLDSQLLVLLKTWTAGVVSCAGVRMWLSI